MSSERAILLVEDNALANLVLLWTSDFMGITTDIGDLLDICLSYDVAD